MTITAILFVLCAVMVVAAAVTGSELPISVAPSQLSLPPKTTEQEDLTTAGQRKVNLVWEYTQAVIAGMVVLANMIVGVFDGLTPQCGSLGTNVCHGEYPVILSSALFLIVGFYFSRTNHAAIGGVGWKPTPQYQGR